jgi:bifunctional non-homologous end joining protein LigD
VLNGRLVRAELPPFSERLPRPDGVGARWCEPVTVVEVAHLGWTDSGRLRQPVYRGVRDDLDPDQVHEES